jgi:ATP-dependent exoDNAse (exonuclease V) beta subunit
VANCRERIEDHEDGTYSIDFRYGQDSEKITIMTIHGSKGLEFEHVILGGVSTNGKGAAFDKSIGALPLSFKWSHKGKSYKSPSFLVEELHYKKSEFSESKRLFYVACTRAVKELSWIDISLNGKEKSYSGNSWINGIRKWQGDRTFITNDEVFDDRYFDNDNSIRENQRPEFHLSNLGIVSSKRNPQCSLSVVPELSVTRFSELAQCSRKFFLSNILKITDEDLEILGTDGLTQSSKTNKVQDDEFKSSKARGSDIHYQIESLIKGDKSIERTSQVIFVEKNLEKYLQDYTLHSEEPVRFSLFGHIVNGTPDLVLKPQLDSRAVEIWDFKTGGQEENQSYWLQLYCYALCFSFEYPNSEFVLKLLYVDAQKIVEKRCTVKDIKDYVLTFWKKTEDYSQVNTQHCHKCNFQNLCQEV